MAINSIGYGSTVLGQSVRNLNDQLTTLSAQLTTGKKAATYAGMGVNEGFAIAARAQLSNISAFTDTMTKINTTINVTNTALQSLVDIGGQVQNAVSASSQAPNSSGQTIAQQNATSQLGSMLRSEEHTSELQSQFHLVCRLLLEKKKKKDRTPACQTTR